MASSKTLRQRIKSATGRNLWLRYALLAVWRLLYSGLATVTRKNISGSHKESPDELARYAEKTFSNYKLWAGIDGFSGRVAEVGPGSVLAIAEMFLADGCSQVDQVDRFYHPSNGSRPQGITRYCQPAEKFFVSHGDYDFIVSCAVLEHLYDPLGAVRAMAGALTPGGRMIHAIDCRDHGQFSDSMHELSFLRIPPALYRPLSLASGLNRVRLSAYRSLLDSVSLDYRILVTGLTGVNGFIVPAQEFERLDPALLAQSSKSLAAIKQNLAAPFRDMPEQELMISGFVLVAARPS